MIYDVNNAMGAKVFLCGTEIDHVVSFNPEEGWAVVAVPTADGCLGVVNPDTEEFVNATVYGEITFEFST